MLAECVTRFAGELAEDLRIMVLPLPFEARFRQLADRANQQGEHVRAENLRPEWRNPGKWRR